MQNGAGAIRPAAASKRQAERAFLFALTPEIGFLHASVVQKLLARILQDDAARLQHVAVMRGAQRGVGVLLDQQNGDALLRSAAGWYRKSPSPPAAQAPATARPSSCSFGRPISARPTASICCSPPESVPASCQVRSFSRGNSSYTCSRSSLMRFLVLAQVRADLQVFQHRQVGEYAPAFRHHRDAALHDLLRVQAQDVFALKRDGAALGAHDAADGAKRGGFAGAVCADQRDDLPFFHAES